MSRLDLEALMTIKTLRNRTAKTEIARLLQVTEGAVRYHMGRMEAGAVDGRSERGPDPVNVFHGFPHG